MNMLPEFLRSNGKQEPIVPRLPPAVRPEDRRQMTMEFMDNFDRTSEENAYLRSALEQSQIELRAEREIRRSLEREMDFIRSDRDRLLEHDASIMNSLENIETLIVSAKAKARAEAYAPPGSGTQGQTEPTVQDQKIIEGLAEKLMPAKEHE